MSPQVLALLLGITALLALVPAGLGLGRAVGHGDWDLTSSLVLLAGLAASLPTALASLAAQQTPATDAFGTVQVGLSATAYRLDQAANATLLAACLVFFVVRCCSGRAKVNVAPLIAAAICLVTAVSDGLNGHQIFASRQVVLLAVLLAAAVARPGRPAFLGAAACGLLLTVLGGLRALLRAQDVFRDCRSDKCGVLGVLYTGVFPNENTFGLALALSVPFVWLGLRGRVRVVLACYVAAVVVATGSRQAIVTAAVALLLLLVLRPHLPEDGPRRLRPARALGAAGAAAAVGLMLPFLPFAPESFSQRAQFWAVAREQLPGSPLFGFGAKAWGDLYHVGQIPVALTYSPHNQWIDVLYAGGLTGLVLFLALLAYLLLRGGRQGLALASCLLTPVLVAACLERPWSFGISDWLTFTLVATALLPVTAKVRLPSPVPPARPSGAHATAVSLRATTPTGAASRPRPAAVPRRTPRR
ncbi:O-antigen ligase family protein [Kitasatospora sp. McL0602]|uniref:O-antigen ligase family protein n=1 Tax=Kitasatospora sp. McL0602 TaxID=3439530 RepID=UPI003F8A130F